MTTRESSGPEPVDQATLDGVTGGAGGWPPSQGGEGLEGDWTAPAGGVFQGLGAAAADTREATPEAVPNRKIMS